MVEMLGVLAVIGVLSIGGIAGYTTAMSYYRANEILNDVTLRATAVATDIATNGAKTNGESYETDLGDEITLDDADFDPTPYPDCDSDADCTDAVCSYGRCVPNNEYCSSLSFTADACKDKNPENLHCLNHRCIPNCTSDSDCEEVNTPYCLRWGDDSGRCVPCMENAHCETGYYCSSYEYISCAEYTGRSCSPLNYLGPVTVDGRDYYISRNDMKLLDAENFCESLGKSLVPANILNTKGVAGSATKDSDGRYKTALVGQLYDTFVNDWGLKSFRSNVWTATNYGTVGSVSKNCDNYYWVHLETGSLLFDQGYIDTHALCW